MSEWRWMTGLSMKWMNGRKGEPVEVDDTIGCAVDEQE